MTDETLTPPPIGPFFRFPDEATGMAFLRDADLTYLDDDNEEHVFTASHQHSLDVIGIITRGGEWDAEGNTVVPPTTLPGWHVNYSGELPDGWAEYSVTPEQPVRIFF